MEGNTFLFLNRKLTNLKYSTHRYRINVRICSLLGLTLIFEANVNKYLALVDEVASAIYWIGLCVH